MRNHTKQLNLNISSNGNRIAQFPDQAFIELITPNVFEQDMQILKFSNVSFKRLTSVTQYLAILVRSTAPILELQIKQNKMFRYLNQGWVHITGIANYSFFLLPILTSVTVFSRNSSSFRKPNPLNLLVFHTSPDVVLWKSRQLFR